MTHTVKNISLYTVDSDVDMYSVVFDFEKRHDQSAVSVMLLTDDGSSDAVEYSYKWVHVDWSTIELLLEDIDYDFNMIVKTEHREELTKQLEMLGIKINYKGHEEYE